MLSASSHVHHRGRAIFVHSVISSLRIDAHSPQIISSVYLRRASFTFLFFLFSSSHSSICTNSASLTAEMIALRMFSIFISPLILCIAVISRVPISAHRAFAHTHSDTRMSTNFAFTIFSIMVLYYNMSIFL